MRYTASIQMMTNLTFYNEDNELRKILKNFTSVACWKRRGLLENYCQSITTMIKMLILHKNYCFSILSWNWSFVKVCVTTVPHQIYDFSNYSNRTTWLTPLTWECCLRITVLCNKPWYKNNSLPHSFFKESHSSKEQCNIWP